MFTHHPLVPNILKRTQKQGRGQGEESYSRRLERTTFALDKETLEGSMERVESDLNLKMWGTWKKDL